MKTSGPVFGEKSFSKVAALFGDEASARGAATRLRDELGLGEAQVQVVTPDDPRPGRKIEPDSRGIWHTALKAHATFGALGILAGLALFFILSAMGVGAVRSSPWAAGGALVFFGAVFGLFAGGFVTLRPDQDVMINQVREAIEQGRFALVAHPENAQQRERITALLEQASVEVVGTL